MITRLNEAGELGNDDLMDNYVTFMAGIFRSVRFGASSAHGKANMVRFNFFQEQGAFVRDTETGTYSVDFDRMQKAMSALSKLLLTLHWRAIARRPGSTDEREHSCRYFV